MSSSPASAFSTTIGIIACRNASRKKHCGESAKARNHAFGDWATATPNSAVIPARYSQLRLLSSPR
jgi:hypothetical protein